MQISDFSTLDIYVAAILALSVIIAVYRGFLKSAIAFTGWVIAFILAIRTADIFAPLFSKYTAIQETAEILSSVSVFFALALLISLLNNFLYPLVAPLSGGIIDRSLGLLFGLIRGCAILSIGTYMLMQALPDVKIKDFAKFETARVSEEDESWMLKYTKGSQSLDLLLRGAEIASYYIPRSFGHTLQTTIEVIPLEFERHSTNSATPKVSLHTILQILPAEVLSNIAEEDIESLRDPSTPSETKVRVLENISYEYQKYHKKIVEPTSEDERSLLNTKYEDIMSSIERHIVQYNKSN